jgi:hypothetical protein
LTITIIRKHPGTRIKTPVQPPSIREVCLVGDPARRYVHTHHPSSQKDSGLRTQDSQARFDAARWASPEAQPKPTLSPES